MGRVKRVTYNGQDVVRDVLGQYDAWGNPAFRQYGSGATDGWGYNNSGTRVTTWAIGTVGETPQPARTYGYDSADRLTQAGEWETLGYDLNSRLTKAKWIPFGIDNDLNHDAYNNNIFSTGSPQYSFTITLSMADHNSLPRSENANGQGGLIEAEYDNFGEMTYIAAGITSSDHLAMAWYGLGRMTSTTYGPPGNRATESYQYAASGLRVTRIDSLNPALNRVYAYTGTGQLLSEYTANPAPTWKRDVIYLGSQAIAEVDASGVHELHSDHIGSPRVITGPDGTSTGPNGGTQAYGPYGELRFL
jgi:hypothetical protein